MMAQNKISKENKRVVILGSSPLPVENTVKNYASGARTWQFANSARDANCDVMIIGYRIPGSYEKELPNIHHTNFEGIDYYSVPGPIFEDKKWLKEQINQYNPDCIVGVNTHPSSVAADLDLDIPLWVDLNGSVMAEAQSKAYVYNDDSFLQHFFEMESKALNKADVFSVVSEAQGFSLIGELGIWGRLNKHTMGYRFVRVIQNAAQTEEFKHTKSVIRGVLAKETDFVVLYSGGYNTWTDVDTLFHGLEKAMAKKPNLVFVSTGGQIDFHDDLTYPHFRELIDKSKFKDRFHLCGWVTTSDLPNYYLEADLGINSDRYCYEAILGARTRILDWLRVPLTFISTPLSEITQYLIQNNLAYGFKQADSDDLAEKLVRISSDGKSLENIKKNLRNVFNEEFTSKYTFKDFKDWIKDPQHAPDKDHRIDLFQKGNTNHVQNKTKSFSLTQKAAISIWPYVFSALKFFRLSKHEESVQVFGTNLVFKTKPSKYQAKFLKVDIPEMLQNGKYIVPVVIQNIGNVEWKNDKESTNAVNLSYIWKDKDGNVIMKNEERTPLPQSINKGDKIKIDAMVTAPEKPGDFVLELDLIKEREFWFSEVNSQPYTTTIKIKKKSDFNLKLPKVSVIVVSYNSEKYISQCITSLLNTKYPNFEIIVVDNASTDKHIQTCRHSDTHTNTYTNIHTCIKTHIHTYKHTYTHT